MIFDSPIFTTALIVAVLVLLVYQQIRPRELKNRRLIVVPLIILFFLVRSIPGFQATTAKSIELGIMVIVSLVFGLLSCRQLKVYRSDSGTIMSSGSWKYFLWWLAAFLVKALLSVIFGNANFAKVSQFEFMMPPFFLLSTRNIYLYRRAAKLRLKAGS